MTCSTVCVFTRRSPDSFRMSQLMGWPSDCTVDGTRGRIGPRSMDGIRPANNLLLIVALFADGRRRVGWQVIRALKRFAGPHLSVYERKLGSHRLLSRKSILRVGAIRSLVRMNGKIGDLIVAYSRAETSSPPQTGSRPR